MCICIALKNKIAFHVPLISNKDKKKQPLSMSFCGVSESFHFLTRLMRLAGVLRHVGTSMTHAVGNLWKSVMRGLNN